jgi:hypothetical protein
MLRNVRRLAWAGLFLAAPLAAGCGGSDGPTDPDVSLVGTWNVTHLAALGTNFISLGMAVSVVFNSNDTYSFSITGDLVGICEEPATSCTQTGTWSSTSSQLTLDPSDADPVTFSYSITGSTMTWAGALAGVPATVTLVKQ